jgi:hypothetical protein
MPQEGIYLIMKSKLYYKSQRIAYTTARILLIKRSFYDFKSMYCLTRCFRGSSHALPKIV